MSWPLFVCGGMQLIHGPDARGQLEWKEVWQDGAAWDVWIIYTLWVALTPVLIAFFGKTFIVRRALFINTFSCTLYSEFRGCNRTALKVFVSGERSGLDEARPHAF